MSVFRQDPATGGWVIVAPERGDRPREDRGSPGQPSPPSCPFCPGHEAETPPELLRLPATDGVSPWGVRVVPNKFAVLAATSTARGSQDETGLLREMHGIGHHELVVESPLHDRRMADMSPDEIAPVLDAYHARYLALRRDPQVAYVIVFKNRGLRAGASLAHAHSQIVATPMAPLGLERRYARARVHFETTGHCLFGDLIEVEVRGGVRIVCETERMVAFCPFASGVPFETWIAPKRPQPSFGSTSAAERRELAEVLGATLGALDAALGAPDFNYVLHTAPVPEESEPYYQWHLQILPRITTLAGFELGSGIPINTEFPEEAAAVLRRAMRP